LPPAFQGTLVGGHCRAENLAAGGLFLLSFHELGIETSSHAFKFSPAGGMPFAAG
jgi:hypothetical protein